MIVAGFTGGSFKSSDNSGESASNSVILPGELFREFINETLNIIIGVYESASLFPRHQNGSFQIASSVVSVTVSEKNITGLEQEVIITMKLESEVMTFRNLITI